MHGRRQAPGAGVNEHDRSAADTRSLRASGSLDKPAALRSLNVCLDSKGPFIDAISAISAFVLLEEKRRRYEDAARAARVQRLAAAAPVVLLVEQVVRRECHAKRTLAPRTG